MKHILYYLLIASFSYCSNEQSFNGHWYLESSTDSRKTYVEWIIQDTIMTVYDDDILIYENKFKIDKEGYTLPLKTNRVVKEAADEILVYRGDKSIETYRLIENALIPPSVGDSLYLNRRYSYYLNNQNLSTDEKKRWQEEYDSFIQGRTLTDQ